MAEPGKVDLVGVGLNAIDTLIPLAHFPARGSKTEYTSASILPGGQAATTVIACQTWGLTTRYVGKLGDDEAGQSASREFARAGVDARLITVPMRPVRSRSSLWMKAENARFSAAAMNACCCSPPISIAHGS